MRPAALLRLALAGTRTDGARVALTALSATLATLSGLAALTVLAVVKPPGDARAESVQYTNALLREPGLRPGVAFALLMLMVPVLGLAGQCARLGAPARDRRLAALRLAGATPGEVTRIAALETGLASLLGTLAGLAVHLIGRRLLHRPGPDGRLALPTDVQPAPAAVAAVVIGLPLAAALVSALLLRRVTTTPFGVVRRARARAPWPWPGLLILVGLAMFAAFRPVGLWYERRHAEPPLWLLPALLIVGSLAAMVGVVAGTGWISHTTGRLLHRYARRPAALLAARRLTADPWAGSRTFAALLAALIFGAGAAGIRADFLATIELHRRIGGGMGASDAFYLRAMDLVDLTVAVAMAIAAGGLLVAVVEGITARRRAYAALVATGVPRATIGRSLLWQSLAPAVPAIGLALAVGYLLVRGVYPAPSGGGYPEEICDAGRQLCGDPLTRAQHTRTEWVPKVTVPPDVPWEHLAWFAAGGLAAVLLTVGVGLLFLRAGATVEELRTT
ncbi:MULTISPECIES: FtsX-like permease family protein [Micromonospora]|uniref:ABC transporter permease n=1 Tax=Micromonospora solifontis TaxID=2487138 RepID=A0ABX9WCY2_9ACTN|nr:MULTISPECIES: FtsX-like permease family protein [Micromonospora]NES15791.1 FtsX-like permease family protein [Micromonospora sp. PPF5-17B]NES38058.1 FtsX-like permease family protein [Micromonospora solifontis]NES56637.1 FtsX-like permease family protein [Micromonospora sp. PPF5-6]RNL97064.1 ABC transporter permease [Micromonospora solifontis]